MLQDALVKLDQEESAALLQEINPRLEGGPFAPGTVTILGQELSFYPGYRFQAVDCLLTNFHLPKSSLLLLVAALLANQEPALDPEAAIKLLQRIYAAAIAERYRFYSFGDAMLIL